MAVQSKKFAKNYEILEEINEKLQDSQDNPALLDDLAPMLEQASKSSSASYNVIYTYIIIHMSIWYDILQSIIYKII